jgi:small-conductance mechanosensitive channel
MLRWPLLVLLLLSLLGPAPAPASANDEVPVPVAPVVVDGETLFRVRGVTAFPAGERARAIADRIVAAAADRRVPIDTLRIVQTERSNDVMMGDRVLASVLDADAALERVHRDDLAKVYVHVIRQAVDAYRRDREPRSLLTAAGVSLAATVVLVIVLWALVRLWRRLLAFLEDRYAQRVHSLEIQSIQIVHGERIRAAVRTALRLVRAVVLFAVVYLYLSFVLAQFPWTRRAAARLSGYVLGPLGTMGNAILDHLPNLVFLVLLFFVVRYALQLVGLVFSGVERGTVSFAGFEREWAAPTFRIVRVAIIGFALVVAYPYIPGSESAAFKGVSLFFGLVFSLGASSVVGNMMAGYSLIYRRTFKVGDRVRIKDVVGDVTQMGLQVTHVRTVKNEDVVVPNSEILGSEVVNYSTYAAADGLILHTTVGIGYEVPWRQVEAMLLLAASRTPRVRTAPAPFVRQLSLGDFAVQYELNAYCSDAQLMGPLYTALHRNILDVFNEHGVQIMTPAYEGDPPIPKVVPKEQWYSAPAPMREDSLPRTTS